MRAIVFALGVTLTFGSFAKACNERAPTYWKDIAKSYRENPIQANRDYQNKHLYISGIIKEISSRKLINLIYFDENFQIQLNKKEDDNIAALDIKDGIIICGNLRGYIGFTDIIQVTAASITHVFDKSSRAWRKVGN